MTGRVVYMGTAPAIDADELQAFTPRDIEQLVEALAGRPDLVRKIERARDWKGSGKSVLARVSGSCAACPGAYEPEGTERDIGRARRWAEEHIAANPGHTVAVTREIDHLYGPSTAHADTR